MSVKNDESNDLTTDAIPNPRPSGKDFSAEETINSEEGDYKDVDFEDTIRASRNGYNTKRLKQKLTKIKRMSATTCPAQATIININNSKDIHVGDKLYYNVNGSEKPKSKAKIIETNAIRSLKSSTAAVTREDINFISTHMDETWQDTARALDYSDGQIQQFLIDHRHYGTKEVIYQLLLDWIQNEPDKAKVGNLSNILWENNQRDTVKRWSEEKK